MLNFVSPYPFGLSFVEAAFEPSFLHPFEKHLIHNTPRRIPLIPAFRRWPTPRKLCLRRTPHEVERENGTSDAEEREKNVIDRIIDSINDVSAREDAAATGQRLMGREIAVCSDEGAFEVKVHLGDCDPDKVKVEAKEGILTVEGRRESGDGSFTYVRHQQTIPRGVSASSLKASLLPDGTLRVAPERARGTVTVLKVGTQECKDATSGLTQKETQNQHEDEEEQREDVKT